VDRRPYAAKAAKQPPPSKPTGKRLDVDNITMERLEQLMSENPRGLAWFSDELMGCVLGLDMYKPGGKGNDKQALCKFQANKPTKRDRAGGKSGPEHTRVDETYLTLIGGMVPDSIKELRDKDGKIDGFMERFLISFPAPGPLAHWSDEGIDEGRQDAWDAIIKRLAAMDMAADGRGKVPNVVALEGGAKAEFIRLYNAHIDEINAPGFDPALRGCWGKMRDYAGRLALLLAGLRDAVAAGIPSQMSDPYNRLPFLTINQSDIHGDWRIVEYYKSGYVRAQFVVGGADGASNDVRLILHWLRATGKRMFTERELYRDVGKFRSDRSAMHEALGWLAMKGVVRQVRPEAERPGRRSVAQWEVNPSFDSPPLVDIGHLGHNSADSPSDDGDWLTDDA
jgi:hypothetical protein